jgi:hypothetical protein
VRAPAVSLGEVGVAGSALVCPCCLRARDVHELAEVLLDLVRCGLLGFVFSGKSWREQTKNEKEKSEGQSAWPHSDLQKYYSD